MAQYDNRIAQAGYGSRTAVGVDEGPARLHAARVQLHGWRRAADGPCSLLRLGGCAIANGPAGAAARMGNKYLTTFGAALYGSPLKWVVMLAPIAFVFFLSFRIYKMSVGAAQIAFWLFAATMGVSLSSIFLVSPASRSRR